MKIKKMKKELGKKENPLQQLNSKEWLELEIIVEATEKEPEQHFSGKIHITKNLEDQV